MSTLQQQISLLLSRAIEQAISPLVDDDVGLLSVNPQLQTSQHAHFQANAAMALAKRLKTNPRRIATTVVE